MRGFQAQKRQHSGSPGVSNISTADCKVPSETDAPGLRPGSLCPALGQGWEGFRMETAGPAEA